MLAEREAFMRKTGRFRPYTIALAASLIAFLARDGVESIMRAPEPFLFFLMAVAFSAWYGGFRPGLFSSLILVLAGIFHVQPDDVRINFVIRPISFLLSAGAICIVVRELRIARNRAETHAAMAKAAERSLHSVLESTEDAVVSLDSEFRCTYVNENAARQAGQSVADLTGRKPWEVFPQLAGESAQAALAQAAIDRSTNRFEVRSQLTGEWFECSVYPTAGGMNLFVHDITADKMAEDNRAALAAAIENERERLATVLNDMPVAVLVISQDLTIEIANPMAKALFGELAQPGQRYQPNKNWVVRIATGAVLPTEDRPVLRALRDGKYCSNMEVEYEQQDGSTLTVIVSCIPLKGPQGQVRAVLATYSDVTSLRSAQAALAASEHRLRFLFKSPTIGIFSGEGEQIKDANPAFLSMLGYTPEEFHTGEITWTELTPPEMMQRDARAIAQVVASGYCEPFEKEYLAKDGRRVPVLIGIVSTKAGTWSPWVVWVLDLTERRRLEERLTQRAKLESVGVLAGGVAHDFNNLLTSIMGNTTLAADQLPEDSEIRELLDYAILATERAADLTRQLLAYAGKGNFVIRPVDVSRLVNETFAIVRGSMGRNVICRLHLADRLSPVEADATQIQQVVMNLMINAAEAIGPDDEGRVDIETGTLKVGSEGVKDAHIDNNLQPGTYVYIQVRDTGCGMDEQTQRQIFDPFFTTKFTGRGLGLAASLGIARSHNGAITVKTAPGAGSTFLLLLPAELEPEEPDTTALDHTLTGAAL
jgi:PAS domain S-box-containing protein